MKVPFLLCVLLFGSLFLICPIILATLFEKKKLNKWLALSMLALFSIALICGVFSNFSKTDDYIHFYFDYSSPWASETISFNIFKIGKFDLAVNLVLLFPVGVVLSLFLSYKKLRFSKQLLWLFVVGLSLGLFIETMQFILPISRAIQLSDVILNTISCIIGGLYFLLCNLLANKIRKKS